jgi:hypothetical protein
MTSLPAAIAITDEFDCQINFNSLKKSTTSLSATIRALDSPLGPHPESDLVTDLYFGSTPIANMGRSGCPISFNSLNKSIISLSVAIGALSSLLGPHSESYLETYLYSGSTPIANMNRSGCQNSFNSLNKSIISLSVVIEALGSPLGPR